MFILPSSKINHVFKNKYWENPKTKIRKIEPHITNNTHRER